ncbi:MAG TPA: serine/threonine-protein kinase, partial [Burkholderiaceae bacterium]
MSTVPERIGKYEITQVLGQGSMGVVYKALDPHIQRPVAIKVIHKALLGDSGEARAIAARFLNEAKAVGRIAHPGVVAIYEFGEDAETAYIAMEFVNGRNLDDILAEVPVPTQEQTLHVMDGLLDALSHAHAQGVWHRDVKPANLMIAKGGQVKLTDFGIARVSDANLTQVSSMIGTPSYMSPEQFRGEGIDHRADLFASGVLLYRLLTGKRPFRGSSQEVMYKILQEDAPPPSQVTGGRSAPAFDAVVARAMAKNADDRYPSADAMRQALRDIAHGKTGLPGAGGAQATNVVAVPR